MAATLASSSFSWASRSGRRAASTSSSMTSVSSTFFWKATTGSTPRFRTFSLAMCFWARSLLSQKPGAPIWASIASISLRFWSTSKKPPQVAGALLDVLDVVEGLWGDHGGLNENPSGPNRKRTSCGRRPLAPRPRARGLSASIPRGRGAAGAAGGPRR